MRAAVTTGLPTTSAGQRHSSDTPTSESIRPRSAMISVALGRNEQTRMRTESSRQSLCETCTFVQHVHGRRGQRYLLCRNEEIEARYPRQPVLACPGYAGTRQPGTELP